MKEHDDQQEYELELRAIREIATAARTEIAVMQELLKRQDKALFGNGQPGIISTLQAKVAYHDKVLWIGVGAVAVMQFLSGSGIISLKGLIGK